MTFVQGLGDSYYGGYAHVSWTQTTTQHLSDTKAFLFRCQSAETGAPEKCEPNGCGGEFYSFCHYGPTFGHQEFCTFGPEHKSNGSMKHSQSAKLKPKKEVVRNTLHFHYPALLSLQHMQKLAKAFSLRSFKSMTLTQFKGSMKSLGCLASRGQTRSFCPGILLSLAVTIDVTYSQMNISYASCLDMQHFNTFLQAAQDIWKQVTSCNNHKQPNTAD